MAVKEVMHHEMVGHLFIIEQHGVGKAKRADHKSEVQLGEVWRLSHHHHLVTALDRHGLLQAWQTGAAPDALEPGKQLVQDAHATRGQQGLLRGGHSLLAERYNSLYRDQASNNWIPL